MEAVLGDGAWRRRLESADPSLRALISEGGNSSLISDGSED